MSSDADCNPDDSSEVGDRKHDALVRLARLLGRLEGRRIAEAGEAMMSPSLVSPDRVMPHQKRYRRVPKSP